MLLSVKERDSNMKLVKHYRNDKTLRESFNALAEATFGLNFENWYQNGFWGDSYDPYSVVIDGKVVANVSVNRTDMVIGGERKRLYQLGTVMTDPEYRNRGFIRAIMEEVDRDLAGADGVYLFGNDNVVEFYPKFGFVSGKEYIYTRPVEQAGENRMVNVPMDGPEGWEKLRRAMEENVFSLGCRMVGNPGLIFFYVAQFMQDCVYYNKELDVWAIAELEEGSLLLHDVFSTQDITLDAVVAAFGEEVKLVTLGFAPADAAGFTVEEYHEEDCNFFIRGQGLADFADKKLRIPSLSHA